MERESECVDHEDETVDLVYLGPPFRASRGIGLDRAIERRAAGAP